MFKPEFLSTLEKFNNFEECLLLDFWSENLCRDVVVLISNIWESPSKMRAHLDDLAPVYLNFKQCERLKVSNAFTPDIIDNPGMVNWGINEFAKLEVRSTDKGKYRFTFLWETERRIEIDCQTLEIRVALTSPDLLEKYHW